MVVPPSFGIALRRAFDRGVHVAAQAVYALPRAHPKRHGVRILRDIPYLPTGLTDHLLDVYLPDDAAPGSTAARSGAGSPASTSALRPAVVYVHGGAFCMLSKDTHRVMAMPFAKRGYVVFNINYRLGPVHTYPAPLEDAAAALRWVIENARSFGADPDRLVLAGESAGANLVTALAYMATHPTDEPFGRALHALAPRIRAALPIYGLLDLHDMDRFTSRPRIPDWAKREVLAAAASYVGKPLDLAARRHPLASPLRLYESDPSPDARPLPPFFLACGTADPLLDDSRRLKAALDRRGVEATLEVFHGEVHGFNAMVWRPAAKAKWRALFHFLSRCPDLAPS